MVGFAKSGSMLIREGNMSFAKKSIETMIDLVENKLSCIQVIDRDDARELAILEQCLRELMAYAEEYHGSSVVAFPVSGPVRGDAQAL